MQALLQLCLEAAWFFLPAGFANVAPVFAAKWNWLPLLNRPIDGGKTWRGTRVLGAHKTWRGVVFGILFGSIMGYLQHLAYAYPDIQAISLLSYEAAVPAIVLGGWLGFGGLLGDALKSYFKRRLHIPSGKPWRPFDQIDLIIGALLVSVWFVPLTMLHIIIALVGISFLSLLTSYVGVKLHIKKDI